MNVLNIYDRIQGTIDVVIENGSKPDTIDIGGGAYKIVCDVLGYQPIFLCGLTVKVLPNNATGFVVYCSKNRFEPRAWRQTISS